jgi:hypothetical protein
MKNQAVRWTEWLFMGIATALSVEVAITSHSAARSRHLATVQARRADSLSREIGVVRREISLKDRLLSKSRLESPTLLEGFDNAGRSHRVDVASQSRPIILATLDPDCVYCVASLPALGRLDSTTACDTEVIGIAVDDQRTESSDEFWRAIRFSVFRRSTGSAWDALPLAGATPTTVVIAPGGRVVGWRVGLLKTDDEAAIGRQVAAMCELTYASRR